MDKDKVQMLIFAISPLVIGYLINGLVMNLGLYGISMLLISIAFAAYWIYGGYQICRMTKSRVEANLWGNGIVAIDLCFITYQILLLGRFLPNQMGFASQMFFLPMIRITALIRSVFFFLPTTSMLDIFVISFILMCVLFNLGYSLRVKRE
jgi:hypothetical protein